MMTMILFAMFFFAMNMSKNINPMKISVTILFISTAAFFLMAYQAGCTWMPFIIYLLFMGGILMMFMILSSLSPNEKSLKMKLSITPLIMASFYVISKPSLETVSTQMELKQTLTSTGTMAGVSILILAYFFTFLKVICSEKTSMRTTVCLEKAIL